MRPFDGILILLAFGFVMISLTLWVTRGREKTKREFLLANRGVGVIAGAMSIGASWIWAPAMFLSSQKTYEQGFAGLFWYLVPNIGTLALFGVFAAKLRELLPDGYTLPQYMRERHGQKVQKLYLLQFFALQACSLCVQIFAASQLLNTTTGINAALAGLMIVAVPLTYAVIGGLRASVATDYLQMVAMFIICAITVPWAVSNAGGYSTILAGAGGLSGKYSSPLNLEVIGTFGIAITIGLLSGPLGDQMQWQRAYALKKAGRVPLTFLLGAIVFGVVPLSLCHLGFIAANHRISDQWNISNPQMVGPTAIANLLPQYMTVVFVVMVLAGLCSTIDSSLCAIASLVTTDIYKTSDAGDHDRRERFVARFSMLCGAGVGYGIAQIPGLKIVYLFLFYGTIRAATMFPTILTLCWPKLNSKVVGPSIVSAFLVGLPILITGNLLLHNDYVSTAGTVLVVLVGGLICYFGSIRTACPPPRGSS